ncbi:tRNA nucleotidyltransferase (CCA-adding enzyme) [Desulfotomaculum arcticum]|uniref:tRNA nucleotidyltransferase (CCA-adding enzyme) n=1 Tax=Desulfotruncus arcticus DSM 17038 TaxID=1121424 RepID=A0A1I2MSC5_9FIRM|nr:CBS domain-containing protein [Desulfotruncus arcticus]SFF94475.1 tRNA nucleotidyltransferase (CCA-adding enzyme) [Desulfotomaculum arcticum] [Desulfotruncus arcticus DSM 17038]
MDVITTHTNTDMDGFASMVAAQRLYPEAAMILPGKLARNVEEFLSLHKDAISFYNAKQIDLKKVNRIILVDTKSPRRIGPIGEIAKTSGVDIHIYDHHPRADGDLHGSLEQTEIVGATVTLLTEKIREAGLPVSPLEATIFCLGIYGDTGSLMFTNTTPRDVEAVAYLLKAGANLAVVSDFLGRPMTEEQKSLFKDLLINADRHQINGVKVLMTRAKTDEFIVGLAMITHTISEIERLDVVFVLVEMEDRVHIVGRSSIPQANVGEILKHFKGGGHAGAASATVKNGDLDEVAWELLDVIYSSIRPPLCAAGIMTSPVKTVGPDMSIAEAGQIMLRYGHTGLPVVKGEKLIGVISRRDVEKANHHGLGHAPVKGFMSARVVSVPSDMPVSEIQDLMINRDIGRVPVVDDDGRPVGIVSRTDLLRTLHGEIQSRHRIVYNNGNHISRRNISWIMRRNLSAHVWGILKEAGKIAYGLGFKLYAAGGMIRDVMLGQNSIDIDLVVEGDGIKLATAMSEAFQVKIRKYQQFGTAQVIFSEDLTIDIATARVEFYAYPAALPQVESSSLHQDLYRRDFTINAMAVCLNDKKFGSIVDFFDGRDDLDQGLIRILHNLSFIEDPIRILRAIRFEQRYGFEIEKQTLNFLKEAVRQEVLAKVTPERIWEELKHILVEKEASRMLRRLEELKVWPFIFPGVNYWEVDPVLRDLAGSVDLIKEWGFWVPTEKWLPYLIALLHWSNPETARQICERYHLSKRQTEKALAALYGWRETVAMIWKSPEDVKLSQLAKQLMTMPRESYPMLLAILEEDWIKDRFRQLLNTIMDSKPSINGKYIKSLGYRPGPVFKETLEALWQERLDGNIVNEAEEKDFVRKYLARLTEGAVKC